MRQKKKKDGPRFYADTPYWMLPGAAHHLQQILRPIKPGASPAWTTNWWRLFSSSLWDQWTSSPGSVWPRTPPCTTWFLKFPLESPLLLLTRDPGWHCHFLGDLCFQSLLQSLLKLDCKPKPLSIMMSRVNAYILHDKLTRSWYLANRLPDLGLCGLPGLRYRKGPAYFEPVAIIKECFILLLLLAKEFHLWDPRWKWIFPVE